jgi:hypothetical protein
MLNYGVNVPLRTPSHARPVLPCKKPKQPGSMKATLLHEGNDLKEQLTTNCPSHKHERPFNADTPACILDGRFGTVSELILSIRMRNVFCFESKLNHTNTRNLLVQTPESQHQS